MTTLSTLWPLLEQAADRHGALRIGAGPLEDAHVATFEEWIAARREASMGYLRKNLEIRKDPAARYPWAKSVIAISVPYEPERPHASEGTIARHIARYALGDDYHPVLDTILRDFETVIGEADAGAKTWRYVDTGPLSDRSMAAQAGLGWIGKNGMLIDPEHGSYFFIGLLVTSLALDIDPMEVADRCGECTRCLQACPTGAIVPDRAVDAARCISHATIEQRGAMPDAVKDRLAGNLFGCDICQEVCPWNGAAPPGHPAFRAREVYRATPISDLLRMPQARFSEVFRKSAIKRAKRAGMIRNTVLLSMGEVGEEDASDPGVADALAWRSPR
jgi:epoxyqueuosine reductase